jgi:hypothetical protein
MWSLVSPWLPQLLCLTFAAKYLSKIEGSAFEMLDLMPKHAKYPDRIMASDGPYKRPKKWPLDGRRSKKLLVRQPK